MSRTYSEIRCYSPVKDCLISRISMMNMDPMSPHRHQEYFVEVVGEGREYRENKKRAIDDLVEAIESGLKPGKIVRR